jgi:low affinity Fe/Cu permease
MRKNIFGRFANAVANASGHPLGFALALLVIVLWAVTGPYFHYSDTWQLVINTGTTIVTFLMVFLIQNTQNRDSKAVQIKLDELIRAMEGTHNVLLDLEELGESDLRHIRQRYLELAFHAREALQQGLRDTGHPEIELGEALARSLSGKKPASKI